MDSSTLKEYLLKTSGYPQLTASEHMYLDGFCKEASAGMEKYALPVSALLNMGFTAPMLGSAAYSAYKGTQAAVTGDGEEAKDKLMHAGLTGLATVPFIGGTAAGVGHLGADLNRLASGRKIFTHGAGNFKKFLRYPGGLIAKGLFGALGPRLSKSLAKRMSSVGKVSRMQPFHFLDRGVVGTDRAARANKLMVKNQVKGYINPATGNKFTGNEPKVAPGFLSSTWAMGKNIVPTVAASMAIESLTRPKLDKLETRMAQRGSVPTHTINSSLDNLDRRWNR